MLERVSLKGISVDDRILLLKELGLGSDGVYVLDNQGMKIIDKYID